MKKLVLSLTVIAAAALSSWMPAEKSAASENANAIDNFSLIPVTPMASYGSISATVAPLPARYISYYFTTTAETNVAKFRIFRKELSSSTVVTFEMNAKISSLPRSYGYLDANVVQGATYEYSVCAISADGSLGSGSVGTTVTFPRDTR